jgi:hypothetical protein
MMSKRPIIVWLCLIASSVYGDNYQQKIVPLLEEYCYDCHDDVAQPKGGMNLEKFRDLAQVRAGRDHWTALIDKVETRQMPPPKRRTQPSDVERQQLLAWLEELAALPDAASGKRDPGHATLRRLTRLEYNNTVRDVLGLKNDVFMFPERLPVDDAELEKSQGAMPEMVPITVREYGLKYAVLLPEAGLPADNRAEHGYANRGEAMNVSPLLLQKYLELGRQIATHPKTEKQSAVLRELLADPAAIPLALPVEEADTAPVFVATDQFAPQIDAPKQAVEGVAVTVPYQFRFTVNTAAQEGMGGVWNAEHRSLKVPAKAHLLVRYGIDSEKSLKLVTTEDLWVAGFSTAEETSGEGLFTNHVQGKKIIKLDLLLGGEGRGERITDLALCVLGRRDETGLVKITAGFRDGSSHSLSAMIDGGEGGGNTFFAFRAPAGQGIVRLEIDGSGFSGNHVLLDDLGFITDFDVSTQQTQGRTMSRDALVKIAEQRLSVWLPRLFRNPLRAEQLARYMTLFSATLDAGKSFTESMQECVATSFASPDFLYLNGASEEEGTVNVARIDSAEMATRMSYFLWSSCPDASLMKAGEQKQLDTDEERIAQLERMLADPRSRELVESFAVQWLRLDQLYTAKPDPQMYPAFYYGQAGKRTLHSSFLVEAILLFHTVMRENRSILDFIDADYTWLNLRLMEHYGLSEQNAARVNALGLRTDLKDDLKSERMHSVWWRSPLPDRSRGGFITMAGPLTVTSLPLRTSPVKRGAWLLETVFNRPPQEPKVAFVLKEDAAQAAISQTVRQRFEDHRSKESCASCHIRLDPPGFALEQFDPVGSWRLLDGVQPVDASSEWNGKAFVGAAAYKAMLRDRPEEFVRGFVEHLLSFALGRKLEIYDRPAVTEIIEQSRRDDWKFQSIMRGIITSYPFTHKRS